MTRKDWIRPNRLLCIIGALAGSAVLAQTPAEPSMNSDNSAATHQPESANSGMNTKKSQHEISAASFVMNASQDGM